MRKHAGVMKRMSAVCMGIFLLAASVSAASIPTGLPIDRVNVDDGETEATGGGSFLPSISADGRYVAFESAATHLVAGDTNGCEDIFVRDRHDGTTERVSVLTGGAQATGGGSFLPSISADGRYVAFESDATDLVAGDTNGLCDVFIHDRSTGTTERVSVDSAGAQATGWSDRASISADGRYVVFQSDAADLVASDTNGSDDIFLHDRSTGTTERVSVDSNEAQATGASYWPSISADGLYVAFSSTAADLVAGDTNALSDIFVRDRSAGTTERVSVDSSEMQATGGDSYDPMVSADGWHVAFYSAAVDLVAGDTNGTDDIFVRDRSAGTTERVSVDSGGAQATGTSGAPWISADGRYVAFDSDATDLVAGDTNASYDIFVHDRSTGATERVSVDSGGAQATGASRSPSISADGRYVAFNSDAADLVTGDTNLLEDAFSAPNPLYALFDLLIVASDESPTVNDYITVTFQVTSCPAFEGMQVFLEFDDMYFNVEDQQPGSLNPEPSNTFLADNDVSDGDVVAVSGRTGLNTGGDGTLAVITFRAIKSGSTTITTYNYGDPPASFFGNKVTDGTSDYEPTLVVSEITFTISDYTPVAVSSASARSVGVAALVEWTTQSELDNVGFDILRRPARAHGAKSRQPDRWRTVTPRPIEGRLTAVGPHAYRWLDLVRPGRYEYRVESISATGARERHGTRGAMTVSVRPADLAQALDEIGDLAGLLGQRVSGYSRRMRASFATVLRRRQLRRRARCSPREGRGPLHPAGNRPPQATVRLLSSTAQSTCAKAAGPGSGRPSEGDVKILTRADGVFFVPAASLPVAPRRAVLLRNGRYFRPLKADASGIWFFAPDHRGPYTDLNATFVTASLGPVAGPRPSPARRPAAGTRVLATARAEEDAMYAMGATGSPDPWLYRCYLSDHSGEQTVTLDVCDVEACAPALRVALYSCTEDERVDPDHELIVSVNGRAQAHLAWDGRGYREFEIKLPEGAIREGANTVSLLAPTSPAIPRGHTVVLDYVEAEYESRVSLGGGPVALEVDAPCLVDVGGLESRHAARDVWAVEVDSSGRARRIPARPGPSSVRLAARPGFAYHVAGSAHFRTPEAVRSAQVVGIPAGTEYLAVGPEEFCETARPLVGFRRSRNLSAEYVSLEQAIDTYGHGRYGAAAIINMVRAVNPKYVLLVGDNGYDYLGRTGTGLDPMVPSVLVPSSRLCETNADALFGDLDGDGVPEVPVGRLPVRTPDELARLVDKIVGHDVPGSVPAGVLVADDADSKCDFPAAQRRVAGAFPEVAWTELYLGMHGDSASIRNSLTETVNAGTDLVVYQGHGTRSWLASRPGSAGGPAILDMEEAALWESSPLVYLSTCWSALIQNGVDRAGSIAEVLLLGDTGACAVVGSTTPCTQSSQEALLHDFLKGALRGGETIGGAMVAAQRGAASRAADAAGDEGRDGLLDTVRCYSLLGDPAMPLLDPPILDAPAGATCDE